MNVINEVRQHVDGVAKTSPGTAYRTAKKAPKEKKLIMKN